MNDPTFIVLAKAPQAGRSKTRLCPPCTPEQAAALADAALQDTVAAVVATPATRRVLVLDGLRPSWLPEDVEVIDQRGDGLDERLAAAFEDVGGPALLVGMDTPQLTPRLLRTAWDLLMSPGTDAVLGHALDGGYWAIGLRTADRALFTGVTMSVPETGALQEARLRSRGARVALLPELQDVDLIDDAHAVAALAPDGRFARALERIA